MQQVLTLGVVPGTGLLFGLLLVAAIVGGYAAHTLRVPRVIGYLLAGVAVGAVLPLMLGVEDGSSQAVALSDAYEPLQAIKDLALGLVLFMIGRVFESRNMKAVGWRMFRIGVAGGVVTLIFVFAGVFAAILASGASVSVGTAATLALLLGVAATATAPAATLVTLREYEAKGTVAQSVLGVTGFADVLCIVGFQVIFLLMVLVGGVHSETLTGSGVWLGLLLGSVGSVLLGIGLGFAVSVAHAKLPVAETLLILVTTLIILGQGQRWLLEHVGFSYSYLLTVLCLGAVFTNIALDPERLESALQMVAPPLFVGFFALAGYQLHLEDLWHLGGIGIMYVVCRAAGKLVGTWLGVKWSGGGSEPRLGLGLLCQASLVVGLADFVAAHWQDQWAQQTFVTTILGSAVVFEVCGPILLKRLVVACGEVKAVTLMRRSTPTSGAGQSIMALTAQALMRVLGIGSAKGVGTDEPLQVRHLMRTNVKCIPVSAKFDEVLRVMEQSSFDHFPVVDDDGGLVGVIHYSDLRNFIYDPVLADLVTAQDLCNPDAPAVYVDTLLQEVLGVFEGRDMGWLPVVAGPDSRQVVGIIEQRDLLNALHRSQA